MELKRPGSLQDLFNEKIRPQFEARGLSDQPLRDALELEWKLASQGVIDDLRNEYRQLMRQYKADVARNKTAALRK